MKIITFTHGGIQFDNFDIEDESSHQYLIRQIGEEALNDVIKNYNPVLDPIAQLQQSVAEMGEMLDGILIEQLTEKGAILNE